MDDYKAFLASLELDYDENVKFTVLCLGDEGAIIAGGSLDGKICKCIGVSEDHQGEGLTATVVTELRKEAFLQGEDHLFLFTKPKNRMQFLDMAFFPIAQTKDVLLMESKRNAARNYAKSLAEEADGEIGAIIMNANPFTAGHRYLIEKALERVSLLHVFVVSEDRSYFSFAERWKRVAEGTKDLPRVRMHETKDYLISSVSSTGSQHVDTALAGSDRAYEADFTLDAVPASDGAIFGARSNTGGKFKLALWLGNSAWAWVCCTEDTAKWNRFQDAGNN